VSTPHGPYYYIEHGNDCYHWETSCSKNQYPASGWVKNNTPPAGREQCNDCKAK